MNLILKRLLVVINLFAIVSIPSVLASDTLVADAMKPGQVIGRHIFGLATDANNDPLLINEDPLIYDSVSFHQTMTFEQNTFALSGFRHTIGSLYLTRFNSDTRKPIDTVSLDMPSVEGLSMPTGAVFTPWQTVLFSEAQNVDAAQADSFIDTFKPFYKGNAEMVNPYHYGWVSEVVLLDASGQSKIIKNYAIGRVAASMLYLMPDGRSLYLHDADNSKLLYLFVSEEANNFANGTLYGVSLENDQPVYTRLGSESVLRMKFSLKRMAFKDLFEREVPEAGSAACPSGFSFVTTQFGNECLKLKKRNEKYAGLYEPARSLALKRNGQALSEFDVVSIDVDKRVLAVKASSAAEKKYSLVQDDQIGSSYVMSEVQK